MVKNPKLINMLAGIGRTPAPITEPSTSDSTEDSLSIVEKCNEECNGTDVDIDGVLEYTNCSTLE